MLLSLFVLIAVDRKLHANVLCWALSGSGLTPRLIMVHCYGCLTPAWDCVAESPTQKLPKKLIVFESYRASLVRSVEFCLPSILRHNGVFDVFHLYGVRKAEQIHHPIHRRGVIPSLLCPTLPVVWLIPLRASLDCSSISPSQCSQILSVSIM